MNRFDFGKNWKRYARLINEKRRGASLGVKRKLFDFCADAIIRTLRLNNPAKVQCHFLERISPTFQVSHWGVDYVFSCPNSLIYWRLQTMFTKEPETIDWIDTFQQDDVFFDVGANIGIYSVYAATKCAKVVAFEPEAQNYAELNKNIFLNNIADRVKALCLALSERQELESLHLLTFLAGAALCNFGDALDWQGKEFSAAFKQGAVSYSLDQFVRTFPNLFPNHIKIDVDGGEARIIAGADGTLRDKRLRSILIELCDGLASDRGVLEEMQTYGFKLMSKNKSPLAGEDSLQSNVYNYIFARC